MKRKFLFATLSLAALATAFVSCKKDEAKEEPAAPVTAKSTIKGRIMVNTNLRNDTAGINTDQVTYDTPASGVAVTAQIDTREWFDDPAGNFAYPHKTYTATTDADGDFELTVDVAEKGGQVEVYISDYFGVQTDTNALDVNKVFSEPKKYITALPGVTKHLNIELD